MRTHFPALFALMFITGCAASSGAVVRGVGSDDLLKLRKGPGLDHAIIIGLPDGTRLTRQKCAPTNGKVWCRVSLTDKPGVSGYVAADYLAPR
ncbi:SH3 domain-containing protein [Gemmobacter serpentinus]|uniref:SH3 domain-containing protein n=1 Tax=Gemmobacter serpentinus TaxID=2652247 RepID=UPI00124DD9FE|nr:SH3 domain-containing protein [Gemmobacter serpentinus]